MSRLEINTSIAIVNFRSQGAVLWIRKSGIRILATCHLQLLPQLQTILSAIRNWTPSKAIAISEMSSLGIYKEIWIYALIKKRYWYLRSFIIYDVICHSVTGQMSFSILNRIVVIYEYDTRDREW